MNPLGPLPTGLLSQIYQELKDSNVPYQVDLVDLSKMESKWLERVREEGKRWSDCG